MTSLDQTQPQLTLEQFQYMEKLTEELEGTTGFGEVRYDTDTNSITVSYTSSPPEEALDVAASAPAGLTVEFAPATLTAAERKTALNDILAAEALDGITFGAYTTDEGVVVQLDSPDALGRSARNSLEDRLQDAVSVDVTVLFEEASPEPVSRINHSGAWFGGVLYSIGGSDCSTGFGARAVVNGVLTPGVLSAHHCTESVSSSFTLIHNASRDLGHKRYEGSSGTWGGSPSFPDAVFIETDGSAAGAVYIGGLTGSQALAIAGVASNVNASVPLCYSGVYSAGVTCDHVVQANDFYWSTPGSAYGPQIYTVQAAGYTVGQGDSGGPVFAAVLDAQNNVVGIATGIISGIITGEGTVSQCLGVVYPGRSCSNHALGQSLGPVYQQIPVTVIQRGN